MKTCGRCLMAKELAEFHKQGIRGHHAWCKNCFNTYARGRRKGRKQPDRRAYNLKTRYGLTEDQVNEMITKQGGACVLCPTELTRPIVDHDHNTNTVRGILCHRCNILIGGWDDKEWRIKAMRYIGI